MIKPKPIDPLPQPVEPVIKLEPVIKANETTIEPIKSPNPDVIKFNVTIPDKLEPAKEIKIEKSEIKEAVREVLKEQAPKKEEKEIEAE